MTASSPRPRPSDWEHDFQMAVSSGQLETAKAAIRTRLKAKADHPPGVLERIALNDAIHLLRTLRSEQSDKQDR